MRARFLVEADADIEAAFAFYEKQRSGLGVEFVGAVRDGVLRIQEYPLAWAKRGNRARSLGLERFPYGIVYVPLPE